MGNSVEKYCSGKFTGVMMMQGHAAYSEYRFGRTA
jgi:hypothetical protein